MTIKSSCNVGYNGDGDVAYLMNPLSARAFNKFSHSGNNHVSHSESEVYSTDEESCRTDDIIQITRETSGNSDHDNENTTIDYEVEDSPNDLDYIEFHRNHSITREYDDLSDYWSDTDIDYFTANEHDNTDS